MKKTSTVHTSLPDSRAAGEQLGRGLIESFGGEAPSAVVVFASSKHHHKKLLQAIQDTCQPKAMIGSSSAGEFTQTSFEEGTACAIGFRSDDMRFSPGIGRNLRHDRTAAAQAIVNSFQGMSSQAYPHRSALIMTDALAGHADDFVEQITLLTGGSYKLFGGGAGDDAHFRKTDVFIGTEAVPDAAVSLEILSRNPIGVGVCHGWEPTGSPMRVTEARGMRLISMNNIPSRDIFLRHASTTGQAFDIANPLPFFLHNVIGIATDSGFRLRVPLAIDTDGSIQCAADIPEGATVHIMKPQKLSALAATQSALAQLEGQKPEVAMFFDCVATRLRMGREFGFELKAVQDALGENARFAGCNTYGQIASADGQFNGFHNCTAVVCVFPQ
ncbi:MAG: FIST C-terminal domain-containing protein [Planctomycetes bacterium]|nr:FIST C-terminal domain-containing protein [Planctomycetota bacterium]